MGNTNPIPEIMKTLKERGRFDSPDEVDEFFEKSLNGVIKWTIHEIAKGEGWEESEDYYLNKLI